MYDFGDPNPCLSNVIILNFRKKTLANIQIISIKLYIHLVSMFQIDFKKGVQTDCVQLNPIPVGLLGSKQKPYHKKREKGRSQHDTHLTEIGLSQN